MLVTDYTQVLLSCLPGEYSAVVAGLQQQLIPQWLEDYREMTGASRVLEFQDSGFTFLFDTLEDDTEPFVFGQSKEARMVVAFGITQKNPDDRDKSRMQGFIGGFESIPAYAGYDKGHFISHRIGGMLDQNLFPQKKEVNRGWSDEGKRYRAIERYCEQHPGIFMFSRPLYQNPSWMPSAIEIGYLTSDFQWVLERVGN